MKTSVVEGLLRTSFCTKTSTRFCTECGLALMLDLVNISLFCKPQAHHWKGCFLNFQKMCTCTYKSCLVDPEIWMFCCTGKTHGSPWAYARVSVFTGRKNSFGSSYRLIHGLYTRGHANGILRYAHMPFKTVAHNVPDSFSAHDVFCHRLCSFLYCISANVWWRSFCQKT